MLLIAIDKKDPKPAFRQICDRIAEMVETGALRPGDRLPPTRALADRVGVHRSTVVRAYDELRAKGYVEGRAGSFTTIRQRTRWPRSRPPEPSRSDSGFFGQLNQKSGIISSLGAHPAMELEEPSPSPDQIDFERLSADPDLAPDAEMRRCLKSVLLQSRGEALDYTEAAGWHPLREVLATRLGHHGIAVSPEEILVTAGAQQALDLILRFLVRAGDGVVVEAPTYGKAHSLFQLHRARPLEVPMLKDGMDLEYLEGVLNREKPRMVFTMPNFQNPTGITTSQAHREKLLSLCEEHGVPIVEDGFEEEMKHSGITVLPVKSMDLQGIVLYVGTYSKVVFPGLRIGWIAADRSAIESLTSIHYATCLSGNTLAQAAAARFCSGGGYELYLRRVHRVFRRRMQAMLQGLERHMPPGCEWTRPEGGYTVWLTLPRLEIDQAVLEERMACAGVLASPGHHYFLRPPKTKHLRLSIARVDLPEIEDGCQRLGEVLAEVL